MRILIAEDDALISENLSLIIKSTCHNVANIVGSMEEFSSELDNGTFDAVLLDIRMNGEDLGLEMAKRLNDRNIPFIYVTSFSDKEMLSSAISHRPHGYILKPFKREEIIQELDNLSENSVPQTISLKCGNDIQVLSLCDIVYLGSENVYVNVHTSDSKFVVRTKLGDLLEQLPNQRFARTHQSFAVNVEHIKSIGKNVVLQDGSDIPISRKFRDDLKSLFRVQ